MKLHPLTQKINDIIQSNLEFYDSEDADKKLDMALNRIEGQVRHHLAVEYNKGYDDGWRGIYGNTRKDI